MIRKLTMISIASALLCAPIYASAQNEAVITYRQKVMGSIGANMGAIGDILKFSLPYTANIARHAGQINAAASLIPSAFENNVAEGMTDAKSEIWDNWEQYEKYAQDLESAAGDLARAAESDDEIETMTAVESLGGACKQCHDDFRKPKEESYKNKM